MIDDIEEAAEDPRNQSSVSISRRIRNKSMDYSQSFNEIIRKRQKSLGVDKAAERQGKRMLSINPVAEKNSLIDLDIEELELIERREKLIQIAKSRVKKQV